MEIVQRDRDSFHEEVKILKKELLGYQASGRKERGKSGRSSHASPLGRGAPCVAEDIPPACRPPLRRVTKVISENLSMWRKLADERGRIVLPAED